MSELFKIYIDSFNILYKKLLNNINSIPNLKESKIFLLLDSYETICLTIDSQLKESEKLIKQMDLEISIQKTKDKAELNQISTFKKQIEDLKNIYNKNIENYNTSSKLSQLTINSNSSNPDISNQVLQKQSSLENEKLIVNSSEKLEKAKMIALQVEGTSKAIMHDLEKQTGDMKNIGNKINDINVSLENSGTIIDRMMSRENRNKTLVGLFSVTLVTIFVLILYNKF
jgi:hypothetical protein